MDELKRIAELLRPLWPGVVMVPDADGAGLTATGGIGTLRIEARAMPGLYRVEVYADGVRIDQRRWQDSADSAAILARQHGDCLAVARDLCAALGLEVSDVAR